MLVEIWVFSFPWPVQHIISQCYFCEWWLETSQSTQEVLWFCQGWVCVYPSSGSLHFHWHLLQQEHHQLHCHHSCGLQIPILFTKKWPKLSVLILLTNLFTSVHTLSGPVMKKEWCLTLRWLVDNAEWTKINVDEDLSFQLPLTNTIYIYIYIKKNW